MTDCRIRVYLRALAALCVEVADKPWLLPLFIALVALVPQTVAELRQDEQLMV
jgi:hypothetical protein